MKVLLDECLPKKLKYDNSDPARLRTMMVASSKTLPRTSRLARIIHEVRRNRVREADDRK